MVGAAQDECGLFTWSTDSKYIYYDTGLGTNPAFYRVRVADRKVERLADLKGLRRMFFAWLPWSGVTPDGAPLVPRDISTQEVYALDLRRPRIGTSRRWRFVATDSRLSSQSLARGRSLT